MAEYDFLLVHKPGASMGKADILSRRADYDRGEEDNKDVVFLKEDWFMQAINLRDLMGLKDQLKEGQRKLIESDVPRGVQQEEGVLTYQGRLFVPKGLRETVMRICHDAVWAGHPGASKTVELVRRDFWWPTMFADIRGYVRGCDKCQRTKPARTARRRPLHPNETPEAPWQIVTVDLIGELPESNGFNAICVVVDHFTKQIHAIPTTTKITAEGMAKLYRDHVFKLHGLPNKIIHDRETQFEAKMMKELYKLLDI